MKAELIPTRTAQMIAPSWSIVMLDYGDHIEVIISEPDEDGNMKETPKIYDGLAPYSYASWGFQQAITRLIREHGLR